MEKEFICPDCGETVKRKTSNQRRCYKCSAYQNKEDSRKKHPKVNAPQKGIQNATSR